ncbi:MAG: hypothetical protein IPM58_15590 [Nitrospira sp.]|nr:hypothetical protein [Nitrospira sp.]
MLVALSATGCSMLTQEKPPIDTKPIPLTPAIWFSPSGMTADVSYQNACQESVAMPMADLLRASVPNKLTRVFSGVTTANGAEDVLGSDGVVEVGLSVRRVEVIIPEQRSGEYPASATIGLEMVFLARDGTMLFSKKLEDTGHGTVVVPDQSCEVTGLEAIVEDAIGSVAEGLAQQLAQSGQIREYADQRDSWVPLASYPVPRSEKAPDLDSSAGSGATEEPPTVITKVVEPAHLSYRAIIRDESRNRVLEPDEALTLHLEVKNEGPVEAEDVVVLVNGKAGLDQVFPPEVLLGSIQPGEIKRLSVTKQVTVPKTDLPGELTLNLRAASQMASIPPPKVFSLVIQSTRNDVTALPDVDEIPPSLASDRQSKAVIIAIGIGTFRDEHLPPMKYASHDAAVMAEYLHAIGGVPRERMRIVLDRQGVQEALDETFEHWLRKRADAQTVLYVFFSGRAVVDSRNGEVLLVPYDGTPFEPGRLYSLTRLKEAVSRLPLRQAIFMFDASLDPSPGAELSTMPSPDWTSGLDEQRKDVEMWMVGNQHLQEAHVSEQGKHGLFTYQLLRGLQGLADLDRDGMVVAGELCLYARGEVARVTRQQSGNKQDPLCLPPVGRGAMVRIHPIAKGNNPKPPPTAQQSEESATGSTPTAPSPMLVGP